jgi:polo-like kinase 1
VGFVLSDGASGVHFNDGSKIVSFPKSQTFAMIIRERKSGSKHDELFEHEFSSCPTELAKRVDLFNHFAKYL